MGNAVVTLKKGEGRTLKSGGMWVYDNEIGSVMGTAADGDIVAVHDFDGYPMGKGFFNSHSKIRVRMMTRNKNGGYQFLPGDFRGGRLAPGAGGG